MSTGETKNFDVRNWWGTRSKLQQKLVGSLFVVTLVLIVLLLYVIIKDVATPRVCITTTCLSEASQIVAHVDPNIDPCDDFFKFACGKFVANTHGDIKASSILKQKDEVDRQIAEMIKEGIKNEDPYWVRKEKQFMRACTNFTEDDEEEALGMLKEMLKEINGWPVIEGNNWKERSFDWKEMIYKLRRKGYMFSMMLNVDVDTDLVTRTNRHIIRIRPPYIKIVKEDNKRLYKQYMVEVSQFFGANKGRAESDMGKVLSFMEKLKKVIEKNEWEGDEAEDDFEMFDIIKNSSRSSVKEYQMENGEIDWLDFINNIIQPIAKLTPDDNAFFPKKEFTNAFFDLIYKTDKRIIVNYIIWTVVEDNMSYLPKSVQQLKKNYTCLAEKFSKTDEDRLKYCKTQAKQSFNPQPLQIMYARRYLPQKRRKIVAELVSNIKQEFVSLIHTNTWMDEGTRKNVLEKAEALIEIIGSPGNYFDDSIMEQLPRREKDFQKEENQTNVTFFHLVLNNSKMWTDRIFFKLHMKVNDTKLYEFSQLIHEVNAMYATLQNIIILPVGILQGVFFNPDRPMYLNYGAIGSIVGHELTHGFAGVGSKFDKNGLRNSIWSDQTKEAFNEKIKCIVKEADEFNIEDSEYRINGTLTLEENIADYTGLRVSYAAYKKWVLRNGEEPKLIGVEYTPYQLFWIAAIAYECFDDFENIEKIENEHAHNSFRVIGPIRNNPNFAKDFNCPVGSRMNPSDKCQIF